MIIYKNGDKKRRSGAEGTLPGVLQGLWDWGDNWDQAKRRVGMEQDQRQFDEVQKARKAIADKELAWEEEDRERERLGRKASAELAGSLISGLRPPEIDAPDMQGPSADDGRPLGVEARIADAERRKWDDYERWASNPNVSTEAKRMLFSQLASESEKKLADAQWSSITRRFAQLSVPSKTMRGSDVMGLNPEDPEQAELLSNIQAMIDQRQDPKGVSSLIGELEAEILRDARALERREATLELMQSALTNPALAGSDQLEAMQQAWQRFQRDPGLDPDEAWNDFLDAQKRPVRDARATSGSGGTQPVPGPPRNPFAPVQKFSPYQSNLDLREKAVDDVQKQMPDGIVGNPTEDEIRARMDTLDPSVGRNEGMARGRIAASRGSSSGASSARQDPSAAADMMGAGPKARAAAMRLNSKALDKLSGLVEQAETWQEAQDNLAAELAGMGYRGPEEVPAWLTEMLLKKWESRSQYGLNTQGLTATTSPATGHRSPPAKPGGDVPRLDFGEGAEQRGKHISEISGGPGKAASEFSRYKPKHISEISGPKEKATTWKRLSPEKQASLQHDLLEAAGAATRFDFHGALAPILRAAGVDLGSVPKDVAKRLREALKKSRAASRKKEK